MTRNRPVIYTQMVGCFFRDEEHSQLEEFCRSVEKKKSKVVREAVKEYISKYSKPAA